MNKLISVSTIIFTIFLVSCQKPAQVSTIDVNLQQKAENILRNEATKLNIDSALVLVMTVKTGEVKAVVKLTKSDSISYLTKYTEASINTPQEPGSIFIPFSIMAAIEESDTSLNDTIDTHNGIFKVSGRTFCDRNVNFGGYGKISLRQSVLFTSNIGTIVTVGKVFNYSDKFLTQLQKMSVIQSGYNFQVNKKLTPDFIASLSIGYNLKMTPLQILTCYNAIANNGKMMYAVFKTRQDSIINSHFCSDKTIQAIQQTLCEKADNMLKVNNLENINKIAGTRGTSQQNHPSGNFDIKYCCSYFPSNEPKYTCLVVYYKKHNISEDLIVQNSTLNVVNQLAERLK